MSQTLFTATSGIRSNQSRLTIIANNLANVNTTSFKSSQMNFRTVFSDTVAGGTRPTTTIGGTNAIQIGNGVAISNITTNWAQGGSLYTGRNTDLSVQGQGFFTIEKINNDGSPPGFYLTRAGNFSLDANGNLTSASGNRVLGTDRVTGNNPPTVVPVNVPRSLRVFKEVDPTTSAVVQTWIAASGSGAITAANMSNAANTFSAVDVELVNFSIGKDGAITGVYSNGDRISVQNDPVATNNRELVHQTAEGSTNLVSDAVLPGTLTIVGAVMTPAQMQVRMATVTNPEGLLNDGNNNWNLGANAGTVQLGIGNIGSRGSIETGALESSNVDIGQEFTNMIVTQRGLEAASKVVSTQNEVLRTIINMV